MIQLSITANVRYRTVIDTELFFLELSCLAMHWQQTVYWVLVMKASCDPNSADCDPDSADGDPDSADGDPDSAYGDPDSVDGDPDSADCDGDDDYCDATVFSFYSLFT